MTGRPPRESGCALVEGDEDAIVSAVNIAELYHWILRTYDDSVADAKIAEVVNRCSFFPGHENRRCRGSNQGEGRDGRQPRAGHGPGLRRLVVTGDANFKGKVGVKYIGP